MGTDDIQNTVTIQFEGMTPHIGQQLGIRIIDKASMQEVTRRVIPSVPSASFTVPMNNVPNGGYYWIDMYADLNGNGLYNPPPVDHAWRLTVDNLRGDSTITFVHNTNFYDINWVYQLQLDIRDASPHIGNMFEARVVRDSDDMEMGRARVDNVTAADFSVFIPGLHLNEEYRADFYFDSNHNGHYDVPPLDHAWRRTFSNPNGDAAVVFTHNTDFTDIDWDHLLVMRMHEMTPHLGQLFELRVVDESTQQEEGRMSLPAVLLPEFIVMVPALYYGDDYRVDFYADLNMNGQYDPPPTDHAWRITFTDNTGDVVENFTHNTNFTDIQWPYLSVGPSPDQLQPRAFALEQNYPNPFNPSTAIAYDLPSESHVTLKVYNMLGQEVATLVDNQSSAGRHTVTWNAGSQPSGIYFYRLTAAGATATGKMVLLK